MRCLRSSWLRWCRCCDRIETPYAHVGVPFAIEFPGGDIDLCLDQLTRNHILNLVNLVCPASQTNGFGILFIGFNNQILFAPRTFGACSFGKTAESYYFTCDFHDIGLLIFD